MPLNLESTEYLPHIDTDLTPTQRDSIVSQIRSEQASQDRESLHPSIPDAYEPTFSPLISSELERIAQKAALTGIDVSRYEASALEAPSNTSPDTDTRDPALLAQWRSTLQHAYGLKTYLDGRATNLSLLETYGKNAWLIGNSQLEEELKVLQREVEGVKGQLEVVDEERRRKMEGVKAEMEGLEDGWRRGVRGIVEVELATEGLRREVLERKRAGAGG